MAKTARERLTRLLDDSEPGGSFSFSCWPRRICFGWR